ncbi:MAG TPA: cell division protein ZapA [Acetobacteraceae bacterium]|jgi:cell division protein ZapA|nr:cell division protein ZapA [Acetobacteraceae bacterium]
MAQVTLRINGYAYTIGCRDGEEQHLVAMGREVEQRIDTIKSSAGQSGEARMLVMASLLMADELHELREKLAAAQSGLPGNTDARLGRRLSRMAKRAEEIAVGLEAP